MAALKPTVIIGFLLGLVLSFGIMAGDEQGRVNILHLIVLYVFFPMISVIMSIISLNFGQGVNLAKLVSKLPIWGRKQSNNFLVLSQRANAKLNFFYLSQFSALSFSFASLLIFFILLITTDVNFVWRSTLLDVEFVHSLLEKLALPWLFWSTAQPDIELLKITQDSRMVQNQSGSEFGQWWQFILAAQLFYAVLVRLLVLVGTRILLKLKEQNHKVVFSQRSVSTPNKKTSVTELVEPVNLIEENFALTNWGGLNESNLKSVKNKIKALSPDVSIIAQLDAGPLFPYSAQLVSARWQEPQLIIVKGWEPPLAELSDYIQNGQGYVLPLDWDKNKINTLSKEHLEEWGRFLIPFERWQLLQLEF